MKDDFFDLLSKKEELDPELVDYIRPTSLGEMVNHPLVQEIFYRPQINAFLNRRLKAKKEALAIAEEQKDWHQAIFLHERPYRFNALFEDYQYSMNDEAYWSAVGEVWTDSENIWQNYHGWLDLWENERTHRECVMDDTEWKLFDELPETLTIYRGIHGDGLKYGDKIGLAWTLDKAKAKWFADRYHHPKKRVLSATIAKKDVFAYFIGRNENEVVVKPSAVNFLKKR